MANILDYQGNAGLGIGSTPGATAPLGPNDNLKNIDAIGRDVMLLDAERNTKIFQQKIADRDNLTKLILDNQVSAGEIDPKYHKEYDDAQKGLIDAYHEWGGNPNDVEGYRKYQEAHTKLQDVATHAQVNTIELKKLIQQRADQTLPWKQKALDEHIDQQKNKDFWDHVDPYQQMFSLSIDPIKKLLAQSTSTVMSPDRLWKYDVTKADYTGTLKNAREQYMDNGETAEDMRQLLWQVDAYDPNQKKKLIDSVNGQLSKYNSDLGLNPGDPNYADPIQLVEGPDGKTHIMGTPVDFAAKYALSQQEKFVAQTGAFQKDVGAYGINLEKNRIAWAKLAVDKTKAWAYADRWATQKKLLTQDEQVGAQKYNGLANKIGSKDGRINTDDIPLTDQFIGGIVYDPSGKQTLGQLWPRLEFYKKGQGKVENDAEFSFEAYGKDIKADIKAKRTPPTYPEWATEKAREKGYTVEGHYDTKYFNEAGAEIKSPQDLSPELQKAYSDYVAKYHGGFFDAMKALSKLGMLSIEFHGANGTATPQSILAGSRWEQSKAGKKGFEGVYEPGTGTEP
jgi:hypothetical protein